jgi:hypothetical protein
MSGATGPEQPVAKSNRPIAPADTSTSPAWLLHETANFTIFHTDAALAEKVGEAAEAIRAKQARRWGSTATRGTWAPRCDLYLYPTAKDFARMTGQAETSPGFSTMGINNNRIIARRVNLRADHPQMLTAILPHEVTHVVLADLFTQQQIPRWADEGMAVLSEPSSEQSLRANDLRGPLEEGRLFKLSELMAIDYPNTESWNLYYAQSVSLTQFFVGLGTPEQFIKFVRGAQRSGVEQSMREVYNIAGFTELEDRWRTFARRQVTELASSEGNIESQADQSRRE